MSGKTNLCQSLVGGGCRAISPSMCPSDGVDRCRLFVPKCVWIIHILQSVTKEIIKWPDTDIPASRWPFADGANLVCSCVMVRNGTRLISFWLSRGMSGDGTTDNPRHLRVRDGKMPNQLTHRDIVLDCIFHKRCNMRLHPVFLKPLHECLRRRLVVCHRRRKYSFAHSHSRTLALTNNPGILQYILESQRECVA